MHHPSFGLLGFSRVSSSNGINLFGSPHRHNHYITLTLHAACVDLNSNTSSRFYHPDKELFEVAMSAAQFGELVSSFNMGSGVPVTIEHVQGERCGACPENNRRKEVMDAFEKKVDDITERADQLSQDIEEKLLSGKLLMEDRKQLAADLRTLIAQVRHNVPYVQQLFNESVDETVQSAKAELHEYFERNVAKFGLEQLQEKLARHLDGTLKLADSH